MSQSRLFLYSCLSLMLGIGANNWLKADYTIIGGVCVTLVIVLFLIANKKIKLFIYFWILFYLGLAYSNLMGENNLIGSGWLGFLIFWLTKLNLYFLDTVRRLIAEPYGSLLNGILFGGKDGIGYELTKDFKTTGLTHIIAVSGYNVTMVINSFYLACKPLPYKLRMGLSLGMILGFIILTGGSASVVRAGAMASLVVVARLFGRKAFALNSLVLAAILMIIQKPSILIGDIGFQLSVVATLGLILFNPIFVERVGERGLMKRVPENLKEAFFSTLSAQVLTMPIILYYFKSFSVVSPLANLIILPLIPTVMSLGFLVLGGAIIYFPLGQILSYGVWLVLYIVVWLVKELAAIPYASLILSTHWRYLLIPYLGLVMWLYYVLKFRARSENEI